MTSASPRSIPPVSRTVVKPPVQRLLAVRRRCPRPSRRPRRRNAGSGRTGLQAMCTCASIRPASAVRPAQSTTSVSAGRVAADLVCGRTPTRTPGLATGSRPVPSASVPPSSHNRVCSGDPVLDGVGGVSDWLTALLVQRAARLCRSRPSGCARLRPVPHSFGPGRDIQRTVGGESRPEVRHPHETPGPAGPAGDSMRPGWTAVARSGGISATSVACGPTRSGHTLAARDPVRGRRSGRQMTSAR